MTSQSMRIWRSPSWARSVTARRLRPISRWISCVRPLCRPRAASRSVRVAVERGSMPYSAVTHPLPVLRRNGGTRSSTEAVHSTWVSPNFARHEPSAYLATPGSSVTGRIASEARPEGRILFSAEGRALAEPDQLVGLEAQLPLRVGLAKGHRELGIAVAVGPVHRLYGKPAEGEVCEVVRVDAGLRDHDLELVTALDNEAAARFRADADPVESGRREDRAIRLHRDFEPAVVQRIDQRRIELQQRFAPGAYDETSRCAWRPVRGHAIGERFGIGVAAAIGPVGADEVGVAKRADCAGAVGLAPRPQIAAGKAAEYRRPSGLRAFALQRVEDLLDGVAHPQLGICKVFMTRRRAAAFAYRIRRLPGHRSRAKPRRRLR